MCQIIRTKVGQLISKTTLNSHPYVVSDAGTVTPISVVLRKDGGALSGVVRKGGKPVDAYLYAIPLFPTTAVPPRTFSRPDGTYRLDGIPPGAYRMVALEYDEPVPYREPNALRLWLLRGHPVSVGPNSVGAVDRERPPMRSASGMSAQLLSS